MDNVQKGLKEDLIKQISELNRLAIDLAGVGEEEEMLSIMIDSVKKITSATFVSISEFDPKSNELILRSISIESGLLKKVEGAVGRRSIGMGFPLDDDARESIFDTGVKISSDFYDVTFGAISKPASLMIQKMMRIHTFMGIGLTYEGALMGTLVIGFGKRSKIPSMDIASLISNICGEAIRRRNIETELQESRDMMQRFFDQSRDAIYFSTRKGHPINVNDSLLKMLHYDREQFMKKNLTELYENAGDRSFFQNEIELNEEVKDLPVRLRRKDGKVLDCQITATLMKNSKGKIIGYQGIIRDISDMKSAQKKILEEKERSEFYLDLIGHDIGNLHQGIDNSISLGLKFLDNNDKIFEILGHGKALTQRSINLVKNVLILSRIRKGDVSMENIKLIPIIKKSIQEVKDMYPFLNIRIDEFYEDPDIEVNGNQILHNAIFNLIQNGVKFQSGEEPTLEVVTRSLFLKGKNWVQVEISDHGPGISDVDKKSMFKRLHRKDGPDHGLGLNLVRELVKHHGGTVNVTDRITGDPSNGAKFRIKLVQVDS